MGSKVSTFGKVQYSCPSHPLSTFTHILRKKFQVTTQGVVPRLITHQHDHTAHTTSHSTSPRGVVGESLGFPHIMVITSIARDRVPLLYSDP